MHASLYQPGGSGDDALVVWALIFVFIAAVIAVGVWVTRQLRRRGGGR